MKAASLRVRVLGGLVVEGIEERSLGSRKARTLLKMLALARNRPVPVDRLVDELWGDKPPSAPADQLAVLVSRLRGVLGAERLTKTDAGYALTADWLDVDELDARVAEARDALAAGRYAAARSAATASLALAHGDVLPDEDGEWLEADRARADVLVAEARRIVAESASRSGDHTAAAAAAEAALADDPYDEASLRVLMRAQAALGRPASALAAYARVRERLAEDLGVSPTPDTESVHEAILLADTAAESEADIRETADVAATARAVPPGRAADIAALDDAVARSSTLGSAVLVVVEGEAGIGKTTLLDAWLTGVRRRAQVLTGRGREAGRDLPLQPVLDAFARHLASLDTDTRDDVLAADGATLAPLLGLVAADAGATATVVADAEIGRSRLFAALRAVLGRIASMRTTVLVIDDLHFASPSTAAWLDFASALESPVVLVAATRPGSAMTLRSATRMSLGPLDVDAVAAVVGAADAPRLRDRSGGNPLLLSALIGDGDGDGDSGTSSLADAVARRVASLGDAEVTVRTAAALGSDVDLDLIAAVTHEPAPVLLDHLERAVTAGLLVERGAGFAFRHELERVELEKSTSAARRALVHREAARALANRRSPDALAIAEHARLGGDTLLAVDWYVRAADISVQRADVELAESLLDTALDLADEPEVRAARARLLMATGRLDEAEADAAKAVAARRDPEFLEVAGWVAYYQRRYDDARAFADEGVGRADDAAVRVSCLALGGRVRHGAGDLLAAVESLEAAAAIRAPATVDALARVWLSLTRVHQGRPGDALATVPPGLEDLHVPHPFAPVHARFGRIMALGQLGRVGDALNACDAYERAAEAAGPVGERFVPVGRNCRAWLLRWTGHLSEADECNRAGVEIAETSGMVEARYAGLLDLADGFLLAGDAAGASATVDALASIEHWDGTMAWHQRHRWQLLRARLALENGDAGQAAELARGVASDASKRGARRYELFARAVEALALGPVDGTHEGVDAVVRDLGDCAVLDSWLLVARLAERWDVARWRAVADDRVAAVAKSVSDPDSVTQLASRVLSS